MLDYASRIASLKAEQVRLAQRQLELAAQRREEIGTLAERFGVLETEDDLLAGLFLELKTAVTTNSPRLAQWREAGLPFRSSKSAQQRGATPRSDSNGAGSSRDA
jgi:hypothetical protein